MMIPINSGSDATLIAEGRSTFDFKNKGPMTLGHTQNTLLAKSQKGVISGIPSGNQSTDNMEETMPKIKIKMMLNSDKSFEMVEPESSAPERQRLHTLPMNTLGKVREGVENNERVETRGSHIVVTEGSNEPQFYASGSSIRKK